MIEISDVPPGVDPARPSPVRVCDYLLGGANNFPVDREAAERLRAAVPDIVDALWANRGFHGRAAMWLADHGIRQFIDIGSGLPTQNNTHQAVHRVAPDARVVYVDHDPMVAAQAGLLLASDGTTAVVTADMREPDAVLGDPGLRRLIDLAEPTGVLMTAVLHFVADSQDPWGLVARYMAALPEGSYLALTHFTHDKMPPRPHAEIMDTLEKAQVELYLRPRPEVERFFAGLELQPPYEGAEAGVTYAGLWGAEDPEAADTEGSRSVYCGVARRPEVFTARSPDAAQEHDGG